MAVVAAFELDGEVAAGEAAGHAQGAHGGFGARVHQAHHLHGGDGGGDLFGELDFAFGGRSKLVPVSSTARMAFITGGKQWPRISGPHEQT